MSLKSQLSKPAALLAPGVSDALTALLVEQAGFEACYLSGASMAYTQLGRPDIGLISLTQVVETVARINDRVSIPVIVDADTGFGNALNVQHTVRMLERVGANAIQIEDQAMPKRCGHLVGKELVSLGEMTGKVSAAVDARASEETLIVARTDAIAVEGFGAAIERASQYLEAGADVLFIEAPQSLEQMQEIASLFKSKAPLLANMVEGGRTPIQNVTDLEKIGFSLVITPGSLVRAMTFAAQEMLQNLKQNGSTHNSRDRMLSFGELNEKLELEELLLEGDKYAAVDRKAAE